MKSNPFALCSLALHPRRAVGSRCRGAFTLIELLVVIAILAAMLLPVLSKAQLKATAAAWVRLWKLPSHTPANWLRCGLAPPAVRIPQPFPDLPGSNVSQLLHQRL